VFTGIVQKIGKVESRRRTRDGMSFVVSGMGADVLSAGDSVAINGVCQTVETPRSGEFGFTAVGETLARTTLETLRRGAPVNLETAATPESALGGHIVQGHVDGVGTVRSFSRRGQDWILAVQAPAELMAAVVPKGSVAIDGTSLTVIDAGPGGMITMTIIPFTRDNTIARDYTPGARVNVETDILGKYVAKYLEQIRFGR
jgi:riboflavin synthase alpha subunit